MNLELSKIFTSAFAGALFAFIFIRIAEKMKDKRERINKNINALSTIQFLCNENYNSLNDTVFVIKETIMIFEEAEKRNQDPFTPVLFKKLSTNKEAMLNLINNDFSNDYFSYLIMVDKHNEDIEIINNFKYSMQMARLANNISPANYIENINRLTVQLEEFVRYCEESMQRTQDLLVKSRVLLKSERKWYSELFFRRKEGYRNDFVEKFENEKILAQKELEQVKQKSQKRNTNVAK